jgi:hypothetical protein
MIAGDTRLHDAIIAVCPILGVCSNKQGDPSAVRIDFDPAASDEQKAAAQTVVAAFDWFDFAGYQRAALAAIDARTAELLADGWTYAGKQFALDPASATIWLGVMVSAAALTYPLEIGCVDHSTYNLTGTGDVQAWYAAGVTRMQTIQTGGVNLKAAIAAATTQAGVDAVIDNRS